MLGRRRAGFHWRRDAERVVRKEHSDFKGNIDELACSDPQPRGRPDSGFICRPIATHGRLFQCLLSLSCHSSLN